MKALIIGFGHAGKAYTAALEATFNDIQIHIEDNNPLTEIPNKYVFFEKNKQLFYDIAIVATPPSTHLVVMKKVYTRSKLVIIEKPIAIDRSDHNEILQFANENPGVYFSFHAAFGKELSILPISNLCQNSTIINMAHLFCDPYSKLEKQHLGGPFWDSIYNILSIFLRIFNEKLRVLDIQILRDTKFTFEAKVEYQSSTLKRNINQFITIRWDTPLNLKVSQIKSEGLGLNINHTDQSVTNLNGTNHESVIFVFDRLVEHYSAVLLDALKPKMREDNLKFANDIAEIVWQIETRRRNYKY